MGSNFTDATAKIALVEIVKMTNFPGEFIKGADGDQTTPHFDELLLRACTFNSLVDRLRLRVRASEMAFEDNSGTTNVLIRTGVLFWPIVNACQFSLRQIVRIMQGKPISWRQWLDETKLQWDQYCAAYRAALDARTITTKTVHNTVLC